MDGVFSAHKSVVTAVCVKSSRHSYKLTAFLDSDPLKIDE